MSIIYKALQKTQRNRERENSTASDNTITHRSYWLDASLVILIVALLIAVATAYYPHLKTLFSSKRPAVTFINESEFKNKYLITGIFTSEQTRMVMINNHYFHLGDWIGGAQIVAISDTNVRFQRGNQIFELEIPLS